MPFGNVNVVPKLSCFFALLRAWQITLGNEREGDGKGGRGGEGNVDDARRKIYTRREIVRLICWYFCLVLIIASKLGKAGYFHPYIDADAAPFNPAKLERITL